MQKLESGQQLPNNYKWANVYDPENNSWANDSDIYCYTYTGSNGIKNPIMSSEGNKEYWTYTIPKRNPNSDYIFEIGRKPKNTLAIWCVQIAGPYTANTVVPDFVPPPTQYPGTGTAIYTFRPNVGNGVGDWIINDNDTSTTDQHHIWIWAQYDQFSPIVMCDPIIGNREE